MNTVLCDRLVIAAEVEESSEHGLPLGMAGGWESKACQDVGFGQEAALVS